MDSTPREEIQREFGPQPLDDWMEQLDLTNRDLVFASVEQLTHKQVQKARKGRRISANLKNKIKNALERRLQGSQEERTFRMDELFNYLD